MKERLGMYSILREEKIQWWESNRSKIYRKSSI